MLLCQIAPLCEGHLQTPTSPSVQSSLSTTAICWWCHRSLQNCQLTDSTIMPALIILNHWNQGRTISYSEQTHPMYTQQDGSQSICLPKATVLQRETGAVYENQLMSSRQFLEHLEECCTQNSERLLGTPIDEKKTGRERSKTAEMALFRWIDERRTGWFPFPGVTKSGRVRRSEGPDNEAWSLELTINLPRILVC